MKWIGLTGGIASGKSTVANIIREFGYPVVDADHLAHQTLALGANGYKDIISTFGPEILDSKKNINRKLLGKIVFANSSKLRRLENIVHPYVQQMARKARQEYEAQGQKIVFYEIPLLFEKKMQNNFDFIVLVFISKELQISRLKERDKLSSTEIAQRISAQISLEEKKKQTDFLIDNSKSIADLKMVVRDIIKKII